MPPGIPGAGEQQPVFSQHCQDIGSTGMRAPNCADRAACRRAQVGVRLLNGFLHPSPTCPSPTPHPLVEQGATQLCCRNARVPPGEQQGTTFRSFAGLQGCEFTWNRRWTTPRLRCCPNSSNAGREVRKRLAAAWYGPQGRAGSFTGRTRETAKQGWIPARL